MLKNKYILLLSCTAFFNDRGCHIRILNIYQRIKNIDKILICYPGGRKLKYVNTYNFYSVFPLKDYIGFSFQKIILDILLLVYTYNFIKTKKPKYIISFNHEAGIIAYILSRLYKIPFILDYQGSLYDEIIKYRAFFKYCPFNIFIKTIERYIEKKAYSIIFNTKFNYNHSNKKNKILINDDFIMEQEKEIASFREYKNEKLIFWSGVFTNVQNFSLMFDIIKDIGKKRNDIKFIITGFPIPQHIKKQLKDYNVIFTNRVRFDYFPSILKQMDICISTKTESSEGNSKLFLYKRYCKNIVAIRTKASKEILSDKQLVNIEMAKKEIIKRILNI